jgi:hypothetical protein
MHGFIDNGVSMLLHYWEKKKKSNSYSPPLIARWQTITISSAVLVCAGYSASEGGVFHWLKIFNCLLEAQLIVPQVYILLSDHGGPSQFVYTGLLVTGRVFLGLSAFVEPRIFSLRGHEILMIFSSVWISALIGVLSLFWWCRKYISEMLYDNIFFVENV